MLEHKPKVDLKLPDIISLPLMSNLKKLHIHAYAYDTGDLYVKRLLQAAPNLEDFKYVYYVSPNNRLLTFMEKHNPKLKKIYIIGDDGCTPTEALFDDEYLLKFLSKVKLEEANFYHCCNISGQIFESIGNWASDLKVLRIQRISFEGLLVPQRDRVVFGGGVMHNLTELNFSGYWENLGEEFVDSIITYIPNIKKLYLSDGLKLQDDWLLVKLINYYDLEYLSIQLTQYVTNEVLDQIVQAIGRKKNLQKLYFYGYSFSIDQLKNIYWPNLTRIDLRYPTTPEWLKTFSRSCPNLKKIGADYLDDKNKKKGKRSQRSCLNF